MKALFLVLIVSSCASRSVGISQRRMDCVKDLMHEFKEFSRLNEITKSCNEIIICPTCIPATGAE
jgi:hypothetical protein